MPFRNLLLNSNSGKRVSERESARAGSGTARSPFPTSRLSHAPCPFPIREPLSPELLASLSGLSWSAARFSRPDEGERRSKRKGQSVEFADFRNYVPGDDLRFIDWNTYARLDRLFLKMFLEEEDLHFYALIDASASMDFGDADQAAIRQATGRRAGVHRPGARRSREDRNARPAGPPAGAGASRPAAACGGCSIISERIEPGENVSLAAGRQELLPAQLAAKAFWC